MSRHCRLIRALGFAALALSLTTSTAEAASYYLVWDRNPEPDVTGYRVHWGTSPTSLSTVVDVANQVQFFFNEPNPAIPYYFAVQAYNSSGLFSPLSAVIASTPASQSMSLSRGGLYFGGTKSSSTGPLTAVTPAQDVFLTYTGTAPVWTATSNQPWVQIVGATGSGNGQFIVSVVNPGPGVGTFSATITVSAPNVGLTRTLPVSFTVQAGAGTAPFGSFDTPVNGTAVQGSIPVTGWALDDLSVSRVEIWRDRVGSEPVYSGSGPGNGRVFVANALFIDGSRPDIEAAYTNNPMAYRSGWGYLLLTWGLPQQGNGNFTLRAAAFDEQGQWSWLGSKVITVNNAQATKPFGALDTPTYGQTVSGGFWVFGWALTPQANTTDPRNCTVGAGGVQVGIDSGPLQPVTYGDNRADIAAAFPGFSNGAGAGGAYYLDTTTLSNGIHQIGWLVTDGCGRVDGVGSRAFNVQNAAGDVQTSGDVGLLRVAGTEASMPQRHVLTVRRNGQTSEDSYPNADGVHVVAVGQTERIEIQLPSRGARYAGAQAINGERRNLPIGSSLDAEAGIFYWQPIPGFLGSFDLVFGDGAAEVPVRVVVGPPMRATIDTPYWGQAVQQPFLVAGWALDLGSTSGSGVDTVHVWAYPATGEEPIFLGVAAIGGDRPDVAAVYGAGFEGSAYDLVANSLEPGEYDIVVYPHRAATNEFEGAQVVHTIVR